MIVDSAENTESPLLAVEKAPQFTHRKIRRALEIKDVQRQEIWEFPVVGL